MSFEKHHKNTSKSNGKITKNNTWNSRGLREPARHRQRACEVESVRGLTSCQDKQKKATCLDHMFSGADECDCCLLWISMFCALSGGAQMASFSAPTPSERGENGLLNAPVVAAIPAPFVI